MKKYIIIFFLFTVTAFQSITGQWTVQESGITSWIHGVDFINKDLGFAAGLDGKLLKTIDGGDNWVDVSVSSNDIWGIHFITDNIGWICGYNGVLLFTDDQGVTWTEQDLGGIDKTLKGISSITEDEIWLVGLEGAIFHTVDQGQTWVDEMIDDEWYNDVEFLNANDGILIGSFGVYRFTNDGGETWTDVDLYGNSSGSDLFFINETTGWLCGQGGMILKTTDAGENWVAQTTPTMEYIQDIQFLTPDVGWAVGRDGVILHSTNGGDTWELQDSPTSEVLYSLDFVDGGLGWAVGREGTILRYSGMYSEANGNFILDCFGDSNGAIDVTPSGGLEPYSIEWDVASLSGFNLTNLSAGDYSYIVTDGNGATYFETITITQPPILDLTVTGIPELENQIGGIAAVAVTGGTPPYMYNWSTNPAQSTDTITDLTAGEYFVTVTDANDCTAEGSVVVDFITPIHDVEQDDVEFWVYPNPVNSQKQITILSNIAIHNMQVVDVLGKQLPSIFYIDGSGTKITGRFESSGIYFLQMEMENGKFMTKRVLVVD